MKYTKGKESVEFINWTKSGQEYFNVLGFVQRVFENAGHKLSMDIPAPIIKFTNFHGSTKSYIHCVEKANVIYLDENFVWKRLNAAAIAGIVSYYVNEHFVQATEEQREEKKLELLDGLEVHLTLNEKLVSGGVLLGTYTALRLIF